MQKTLNSQQTIWAVVNSIKDNYQQSSMILIVQDNLKALRQHLFHFRTLRHCKRRKVINILKYCSWRKKRKLWNKWISNWSRSLSSRISRLTYIKNKHKSNKNHKIKTSRTVFKSLSKCLKLNIRTNSITWKSNTSCKSRKYLCRIAKLNHKRCRSLEIKTMNC